MNDPVIAGHKGKHGGSAPLVPCGTDVAVTLAQAQGRPLKFSYWDLWFALVAETKFGGDLEALVQHFRKELQPRSSDDTNPRAKLSHLRDLQERLATGKLESGRLLTVDPQLVQQERTRSRGRVLRHNERLFERSEPMLHLPGERMGKRALRGNWRGFPAAPAHYADLIKHEFPKSCYSEKESFQVANKLDRFLEKGRHLIKHQDWPEAQALLRGFVTAVLELVEYADDSFGMIGQTFQGAFDLYLKLLLAETGIDEKVFFRDLIELVVFEDYGLTDEPMEGYFKGLSSSQGDFCMEYARRYKAELEYWDLSYQTDEALTLLGQIAAEQRRYDHFEPLAREMAAEHWQRIFLLADAAVKGRKQSLAERVFELALASKKGWAVEILQRKYEQLKNGRWDPDPKK